MGQRIVYGETALDDAVIEALRALRGVTQTIPEENTAATIVSALGSLTRFASPRQLMGQSAAWGDPQVGQCASAASAGEASWPHQHRPKVTGFCCGGRRIPA